MSDRDVEEALTQHLSWWGLRPFTSDAAYHKWQRDRLSQQQIAELHRLIASKRATGVDPDEDAFYDFTADPHVLPVVYSERYDYYLSVGSAVLPHLVGAQAVLDFGCGPGILTTFYARQLPGCSLTGIDRSPACVAVAGRRALDLGLSNLHVAAAGAADRPLAGGYDVIVATHALLQAEQDPGIPSVSWRTYERERDARLHVAFEQRTGVGRRLDDLCAALKPGGRLVLLEKAAHLARRIPFQRSLAVRGLRLQEAPREVRYRLVEEMVEDGPLYVLTRQANKTAADPQPPWDEAPRLRPEDELYTCVGEPARFVWERLPHRRVSTVKAGVDQAVGQLRIEYGNVADSLWYVCAVSGGGVRVLVLGGLCAKGLFESWLAGSEPIDASFGGIQRASVKSPGPHHGGQEDLQHQPLYENHSPAAQAVWQNLPARRVLKDLTAQADAGREWHVELGAAAGLVYLYCANTFDQRQLVLVEAERSAVLEEYYQELVQGHQAGES